MIRNSNDANDRTGNRRRRPGTGASRLRNNKSELKLSVHQRANVQTPYPGMAGAIDPASIEPSDGLRDENTDWRERLVRPRCAAGWSMC